MGSAVRRGLTRNPDFPTQQSFAPGSPLAGGVDSLWPPNVRECERRVEQRSRPRELRRRPVRECSRGDKGKPCARAIRKSTHETHQTTRVTGRHRSRERASTRTPPDERTGQTELTVAAPRKTDCAHTERGRHRYHTTTAVQPFATDVFLQLLSGLPGRRHVDGDPREFGLHPGPGQELRPVYQPTSTDVVCHRSQSKRGGRGIFTLSWNPEITEVVITAVLSLVGWAVRRALTRLDEQSKRIADIELALARDYVKHDQLADIKREQRRIGRMLSYIQLQLVALATRLNVRVEPFSADAEEEPNGAI